MAEATAGTGTPAAGRGADDPEAYAAALQDRLRRAEAEVEAQASQAVALRHSVEAARSQAECNSRELCELRARWAAEQPEREALLKRTGETERRLAEKERRCAEALAIHAAAELALQEGSGGGPEPTSPSSTGSCGGTGHQPLEARRSRLTLLEQSRSKLSQGLQELRDASRQEAAGLTLLVHRAESLRRELKSIKAACEAGRESEERAERKFEALDATVAAAQPRQHALERTVGDLRSEVLGLREELKAVLSGAVTNDNVRQDFDDAAVWATNLRLQTKVSALQEQLFKKRELVAKLRAEAAEGTPLVSH